MAASYIDRITQHYEREGFAPYRRITADGPPPWMPLRKSIRKMKLS